MFQIDEAAEVIEKIKRRKNIQSVGSESGAEAGRADERGGKAVGGDQMSGTGNRARGESAGGKLNQLIQKKLLIILSA